MNSSNNNSHSALRQTGSMSSIVVDLSSFETWEDSKKELKSLIESKRSFWGTTSLVLRFSDFVFSEDEACELRILVEETRLVIGQIQTNSARSWKILRDKHFQAVSVPHTKIHNITGTGVRLIREKIAVDDSISHSTNNSINCVNEELLPYSHSVAEANSSYSPERSSSHHAKNWDSKEIAPEIQTKVQTRITESNNSYLRNQLPKNAVETKTVFVGLESNSTLRAGSSIVYDGNVVILGDVNPGCQIKATGSIIVYGKLSGSAHAGFGCTDEEKLQTICVKALKMVDPLQISIGDYSACSSGEMNANRRLYPETAKIIDGRIWRISDFD
ncbi:MAG: septum site-determining protein MinC [Candidatus Melainabacteria bacterium]